jgi:hypothetical protein
MLIKLISFFGVAAFDLEDFLVFLAFFEGDSYFVSVIGITSPSSVSVIRLASSPPRSSALACTLCCNSSFLSYSSSSSSVGATAFSSCSASAPPAALHPVSSSSDIYKNKELSKVL